MRDPMTVRREQKIVYSASTVTCAINHRFSSNAGLRTILIRHRRDFVSTADNRLNPRHACLKRAVTASIFKVTVQIRHQRVTIHYAGSLALDDTCIGFDVGFSGGRFRGADEPSRGIA
jgi:hypothetical protein